jgi:hypothetical protein
MSSHLAAAGITACMKFYLIDPNEFPNEIGPEKDFFVGENQCVTLTIPNGETVRVRNIVVWGKLILRSSDVENIALKGSLIARDVFFPGCVNTNNICLNCRNLYQPNEVSEFKEELLELIEEWFDAQQECRKSMGIKPIFSGT